MRLVLSGALLLIAIVTFRPLTSGVANWIARSFESPAIRDIALIYAIAALIGFYILFIGLILFVANG